MDNKKDNQTANKNTDKNKTLKILIPIIVAILVLAIVITVVAVKHNKKNIQTGKVPVVVTDENGVAVTDSSGVPVTYIAETEIQKVTDENGKPIKGTDGKVVTTIVYKETNVKVTVPVTDKNGENVTDKNGENVTEVVTLPQKPENNDGPIILGTTVVPFTDGQGNTAQDENGNLFTTIIEMTSNPVNVDPAKIDWKTSMGGTQADYFSAIDSDKNGGYIAANVTNSTNGDMAKFEKLYYQTPYTVLVKYDDGGKVEWTKPVGYERGILIITDILITDNSDFYAVGYGQNIGEKNGKGYYDGVVYKFDKKGNEIWRKTFGTSTVDLFNGAVITSDGGIAVVGSVGNNDGDAAGFGLPELETAACIVKYSADGKLMFKNIIGGNGDSLKNVAENKDGTLFCVGQFISGKLFKNVGQADAGVVRFTKDGKYIGTTPIAGRGIDLFTGITACKDGGVVVVGKSNSSDIDDPNSLFVDSIAARGGYDSYIVKLGSKGEIIFAKPFRGQYDDNLVAVAEKEDGTFIVAGDSNSSARDFKGITTRGGKDIVIASFDRMGNLIWARSFGGTNDESANAICLSKDGGYVVAGKTLSDNIDMTGIAQYVNGKSVGVIVKFPK